MHVEKHWFFPFIFHIRDTYFIDRSVTITWKLCNYIGQVWCWKKLNYGYILWGDRWGGEPGRQQKTGESPWLTDTITSAVKVLLINPLGAKELFNEVRCQNTDVRKRSESVLWHLATRVLAKLWVFMQGSPRCWRQILGRVSECMSGILGFCFYVCLGSFCSL